MKDSDVGTIILRVHGDQVGANDLCVLMRAIVADENLRRRCKSIGNLARDIPEKDRQAYAEMCLDILYSWAPPEGDDPRIDGLGRYVPALAKVPMRGTVWADHVMWFGQEKRCHLSTQLRDVLVALEGLWNVPGHLAKRD